MNPFTPVEAKTGLTVRAISFKQRHLKENI